jgi:hypothetical protein
MKRFAQEYPQFTILQQTAAKLKKILFNYKSYEVVDE